ncbi:MAG: chitobiase/beta-hexosaminidase C-terminal domain-containing protein [Eubacterium sp.]|nr:chitobiase/beta-hexosaminidase C-terminal domain-containing protein [Eubacterium sp.]
MVCKKCGAKLKDNCIYCSNCGTEARIVPDYSFEDDYVVKLNEKEEDTQIPVVAPKKQPVITNVEHKNKKKTLVLIVGICVVAVVLGFSLYAIMQNKHNHSYDWQYSQGYKSYEQSDYDAASGYFKTCIELDETQAMPYVYLARIALKSEDEETAISYYEEAIAVDEQCETAYNGLVDYYAQQASYSKISKLMETAPDNIIQNCFSDYVVEEPVVSPTDGTYENLIIELEDSDNELYYTLNGKSPKTSGKLYEEPIVMDEEGTYTLTVVAKDERGIFSKEVSCEYQVSFSVPEMPSVSPDGGTFDKATTIYVDVPSGCSAYYTWDKSTPTASSRKYSGGITVPEGNNVLSVVVISDNGIASNVFCGNYVYLPDITED